MQKIKQGSATYYNTQKEWNKLTEKEKNDFIQINLDNLFIIKHGPAGVIKEDIKECIITLAENNIITPNIPFALLDLVCQCNLKLDKSQRIEDETFDMVLNLFTVTIIQICKKLREKDQTIETLITALKASREEN